MSEQTNSTPQKVPASKFLNDNGKPQTVNFETKGFFDSKHEMANDPYKHVNTKKPQPGPYNSTN